MADHLGYDKGERPPFPTHDDQSGPYDASSVGILRQRTEIATARLDILAQLKDAAASEAAVRIAAVVHVIGEVRCQVEAIRQAKRGAAEHLRCTVADNHGRADDSPAHTGRIVSNPPP